MKNLYIILITVLMFSSVFARASVKHSSNTQPEGAWALAVRKLNSNKVLTPLMMT